MVSGPHRNKSELPALPIVSSTWRAFRYHLGTVAKGSFIITLVKIPRLILTYLHSQLKGKVGVTPALSSSLPPSVPEPLGGPGNANTELLQGCKVKKDVFLHCWTHVHITHLMLYVFRSQ